VKRAIPHVPPPLLAACSTETTYGYGSVSLFEIPSSKRSRALPFLLPVTQGCQKSQCGLSRQTSRFAEAGGLLVVRWADVLESV